MNHTKKSRGWHCAMRHFRLGTLHELYDDVVFLRRMLVQEKSKTQKKYISQRIKGYVRAMRCICAADPQILTYFYPEIFDEHVLAMLHGPLKNKKTANDERPVSV